MTHNILSLGAGVQSTALYMMGGFDLAIFADTQEEPEGVYRHLEWLQAQGGPPILVRTKGKLGDDLLKGRNTTGGRFASIPAYTMLPGQSVEGRVRRQCSKEYKTEVIDRAIRREVLHLQPRQRIPKGITVMQWMGISMDEAGRAKRIQERFKGGNPAFIPKFPLIEKFMTRANCLDYLRTRVPHEVPRSACVFCPYHSDHEWNAIKANGNDWRRAAQIDEGLRQPGAVVNRKLDAKLYIHRSCVPLTQVELDTRPDPRKAQLSINFAAECEGVCGV